MQILRNKEHPIISCGLNQGNYEIKELPTSVGREKVRIWNKPMKEGTYVTIDASLSKVDDWVVRKAGPMDWILGMLVNDPEPKIDKEMERGDIEFYGEIYRLPLAPDNDQIEPGYNIKITYAGADANTDGEFISLEPHLASDSLAYIEVYVPFAKLF